MRTHIRMHFDKKSTDFNEEKYISCVLEDDNTDISTLSATQAAINNQNSSTSQSDVSVSQLHSCDKCNYSSTYKGNVVSKSTLSRNVRFEPFLTFKMILIFFPPHRFDILNWYTQ